MRIKKKIRYALKAWEAWMLFIDIFGWKQSFEEGRPLDFEGMPIPWYTYPAIEFIRGLKLNDCRVFEFGSGNGSIFWAKRVKTVFAVENDPAWANEVRSKNIKNLNIITSLNREDYINAPYSVGGLFDIVIVDGRYRKACADVAVNVVAEDGLIIFDNADWYPDACELIRSKNWFQIDFSGLGPINSYAWTTAVFIKSTSKLGRNSSFKPLGWNPEGMA
jgi:SAM-dependent methyltransferase